MNTNLFTNRKFKRMVGNILSIVMILAVAFPAMAPVYAQESMPHIEAFAWLNRYSLVDWPAGIPVEVTVENPNYQAEPFVPDGSSNWYDFFPDVDLQPESIITATNGGITKVLKISPLSATADANTGNVTGTATGGRTFHMRTDGDHFQLPIEQDIEADSAGNWSVTIGDYLPWEWLVRGEMWEGDEDGDVTYAIWHVQQQVAEVWLVQNEIRAFGWPLDSALTFTVDGNDIATDVAPEPVDWMESTQAVVNAGDLQLQPGMEVTVTDGASIKSTVVQDVKITNIDIDNDIVYGYGPLNADLELGSWEDSPVFRFFNNGEDENWLVDYREPSLNNVTVDLNPGDEIRLFMRDEEKDSTVWGTFAPNPHLIAFPDNNAVEGWEWPEGTIVTLTIDNVPDLEWSGTAQVTTWGDPRTYLRLEVGDQYDLKIGDGVTLTGEDGMTRVHTVQNLSVTEANGVTDIVSGTADQGATVQVWPHGYDQNYFVEDTAANGTWVANFGALGFHSIEETGGRSQIVIDGNATAVDWNASWPPSIFTVNTTDDLDDGNCDETHCSLREAIHVANARLAADTIVFNIPGAAPFTIQPQSPLPNIEDRVTLDGTTQPGYDGSPVIELDGTYAGEWVAGLVVATSDSTVKGLAINQYGGDGIVIYGSGNVVQSNYLGTDVTGTTTTGSTSGPEFGGYDVEVEVACSTYDAGTDRDGFISASGDPLAPWSGTSVTFKGTDECGISEPDTFEGAPLIYRYRLTFDEPTELASIAVSGAAFNGGALRVLDEGMNVLGTAYNFGGNSFQTNYVRLSGVVGAVFFVEEYDFSSDWRYRESIVINGPLPLGNSGSGVNFNNGATSNLVLDNLISGNRSDAVSLYHTGTNGNILQGNYIGTDVSGTIAVPNTSAAIWIGEGASHTLIGGVGEGEGNLISGNTGDAISINHAETTGTVIQGNFIGTDVTGSATLPNNSNGIVLVSGTHDNLIGGTQTGAGNVISGNFGDGVILVDGGTSGNSVQHNFIGTDLTGTIALGNWNRGLYIGGGASDNLVGGNVISGNGAAGVRLADSGTTGNQIQGNFIGTDGTGLNPLGNGYFGIRLTDGAANNMIGGTEPGAGNIIAFNAATGIAMSGDDVTGNALLSNSVFSNAGLGIDLGEDDITLNDPLDRDPGPNNLQNFPIIISVTRKGTSMMINGLLASAPKTTYRLEFFRNDACDPSGYGEGQTFLGFTTVTTNPVGLANFKLTLPVSLRDAFVTATATDPGGNTSEFSKCFGPVK